MQNPAGNSALAVKLKMHIVHHIMQSAHFAQLLLMFALGELVALCLMCEVTTVMQDCAHYTCADS